MAGSDAGRARWFKQNAGNLRFLSPTGCYYRVLRYGLEYAERGLREYEQNYEASQRRLLGKLAAQHGFELVSEPSLAMQPSV